MFGTVNEMGHHSGSATVPRVHSVVSGGHSDCSSGSCKHVKLIVCPRGTSYALLLSMRNKRNSLLGTTRIPYETLDQVAAQVREGKEDMSVVVGEWAEEPTRNYRRSR